MIGIIEEFEALSPQWEQLTWEFARERLWNNASNAERNELSRWSRAVDLRRRAARDAAVVERERAREPDPVRILNKLPNGAVQDAVIAAVRDLGECDINKLAERIGRDVAAIAPLVTRLVQRAALHRTGRGVRGQPFVFSLPTAKAA